MCDREVVNRARLVAGFYCCQSFTEASSPRASLGREGAAAKATAQAQMSSACEAKLKAGGQAAGEPMSVNMNRRHDCSSVGCLCSLPLSKG